MSSREFVDREGVAWRVREIVPRFAERRKVERRADDKGFSSERLELLCRMANVAEVRPPPRVD